MSNIYVYIYSHTQVQNKNGAILRDVQPKTSLSFFCLADLQRSFPAFIAFNYILRCKLHCITKIMTAFHHLTSLSHDPGTMDQKIPYDDYQLPVVFLPSYENPPAWMPAQEVKLLNVL